MPKLEERQLLGISVVVVAIILGITGAGIYFSHRKLSDLIKQNASLESQIQAAQKKIDEIKTLQTKRDLLEANLYDIEQRLPDQKELEGMLDTLAEFKEASGVDIRSLKPQKTSSTRMQLAEAYEEYRYSISLKADFFSFVKFLNLLETYKRFIRVNSFRISQKDPDSSINDIELEVSTFSYRGAPVEAARRQRR